LSDESDVSGGSDYETTPATKRKRSLKSPTKTICDSTPSNSHSTRKSPQMEPSPTCTPSTIKPSSLNTPARVTPAQLHLTASKEKEKSNGNMTSPMTVGGLPESAAVVAGYGSHEHHHWDFIREQFRVDKSGHKADHQDYDPRTIRFPSAFLKDQTPAMKQWCEVKSDYYDTVLFFKVNPPLHPLIYDTDMLNVIIVRWENFTSCFIWMLTSVFESSSSSI
jgi:hypothetical protein